MSPIIAEPHQDDGDATHEHRSDDDEDTGLPGISSTASPFSTTPDALKALSAAPRPPRHPLRVDGTRVGATM